MASVEVTQTKVYEFDLDAVKEEFNQELNEDEVDLEDDKEVVHHVVAAGGLSNPLFQLISDDEELDVLGL